MAGFGSLAAGLESRIYAATRARGVVYTAALVGGTVAVGVAARAAHAPTPLRCTRSFTAAATWAVLGGSSLEREARAVASLLAEDRLPEARQRLTHLVGRDTSNLDETEVARAVVESVAENTSDAVVAPLRPRRPAGVPGLLGYRAANTLDAMVGHRSERYLRVRLGLRPPRRRAQPPRRPADAPCSRSLLGPDPRGGRRAWRRDAPGHPSPNAGPVEASFAGALGIRLGGTNHTAPAPSTDTSSAPAAALPGGHRPGRRTRPAGRPSGPPPRDPAHPALTDPEGTPGFSATGRRL